MRLKPPLSSFFFFFPIKFGFKGEWQHKKHALSIPTSCPQAFASFLLIRFKQANLATNSRKVNKESKVNKCCLKALQKEATSCGDRMESQPLWIIQL